MNKTKKLTLNKLTIAQLGEEIKDIKGGATGWLICLTNNDSCPGDTFECPHTMTGNCTPDTCHICILNGGN